VWDFSDETEDVSEYLKKRFRKEKLKASEKKLRASLDLQDSSMGKADKLSSKTVDEQYFVFENYFGKIVQLPNYKQIEKRDMEKPVRRESLSISPRLAKIMINLSEVKEGEFLLDSFCGIGVILIEALNQEIKVVGVDRDEKAIKGCVENLKWFKFFDKNFNLINEDSSKVDLGEFSGRISGMASEPDFGEILRKIPTEKKAKEMIERYDKIMTGVLKNIKKYFPEKSRFVFTSPYIRIGKKRIGCDFKILGEKTGLKNVDGFPIPEFRENQVVGRQIVVFEK
jgi:tRNA G10  N-methylase Trm11